MVESLEILIEMMAFFLFFCFPSFFLWQIYVGPSNFMVWALDVDSEVYVRQGIQPNFPIGSDWAKIQGVQAVQLCLRYPIV